MSSEAYEFDKTRLDLAREFKANPYGRHSPDLQYLLNFMRRPSLEPYHVLLVVKPGMRWRLALMEPGAIRAPTPLNTEFDQLEEAEWHVFRLRWKRFAAEECPVN